MVSGFIQFSSAFAWAGCKVINALTPTSATTMAARAMLSHFKELIAFIFSPSLDFSAAVFQ
jgi:hypothetical protein